VIFFEWINVKNDEVSSAHKGDWKQREEENFNSIENLKNRMVGLLWRETMELKGRNNKILIEIL